ncbi:tetratricopeptide repeat protein [Neobacillus sp. Marseille-QA0830]
MEQNLKQPTELTIKDKKKLVKGYVTRSAVYARSKVVEVQTREDECHYLIFYKDHFVYGGILEQIPANSFISKAFQEGIVIVSPHPLIKTTLPQSSVTIPNKNKLLSQLAVHFSLQESAYIAVTLDAFFEKDQLSAFMDKIFKHYRRSGQFFKSFQILQLLNTFAPELNLLKHPMNSREFLPYHEFYETSNSPNILIKDPLYAEVDCFKNRSLPNNWTMLSDLLANDDSLTALLLWLEKAEQFPDAATIEKYTEMALKFIAKEEWLLILALATINPFRVLNDSKVIIENMIRKGSYETAALYLFQCIDELPDTYNIILQTIWEKAEPNFVIEHFDDFIRLINRLPQNEQFQQVEQKVHQLAVILLEQNDLDSVCEKLAAIENSFPDTKVIKNIKVMQELAEDPDRMMELGNYYADYKQFDKAIECYFWEMELDPQNPCPVQKISKMYQHKGMAKEASEYLKVYAQLKSNQEAG